MQKYIFSTYRSLTERVNSCEIIDSECWYDDEQQNERWYSKMWRFVLEMMLQMHSYAIIIHILWVYVSAHKSCYGEYSSNVITFIIYFTLCSVTKNGTRIVRFFCQSANHFDFYWNLENRREKTVRGQTWSSIHSFFLSSPFFLFSAVMSKSQPASQRRRRQTTMKI